VSRQIFKGKLTKILFIAHQFPPISGSGSYRPAKFVKYLPQFGWQPYVVTTQRTKSFAYDAELLEDIPASTPILRIHSPFPKPLDKVMQWLAEHSPVLNEDLKKTYDAEWNPKSKAKQVLRIFLKTLFIPLAIIQYPPLDRVVYWSLRIIYPAYKLVKKEQIEIIFSTSAPWSSMLSGLILKKLTGRHWVADLRDPWTTEELRYRTTSWRGVVDRYLERLFLRNADIVIGVTPNWVADLQCLAREEEVNGKYELITNGYDETDFGNIPLPPLSVASGISISHVGSMFQGGLEPILSSLESTNGKVKERLNFKLVGYLHPCDRENLEISSSRNSFSYHSSRTSHAQALQMMQDSHVLLLSLPFEYYPGKVFEYMRLGRPVLALVPEGPAANLITEAQIGCVVNRVDIDALSQVFEDIALDYDGFVERYYRPNWEFIKNFERKNLTKKLAAIFDRVAA